MKPDGKAEGLRQANSWLHTWTGLPLGWLLYAVFFTGTLSFFLDEVNVWMKPELHRSVVAADTATLAQTGIDGLQRLAPGAETWTLVLPGPRQVAIEANWREAGAAPGRAGNKRAELDATTGEAIETRATRGGSFLYRFHFELYAMPRIWGRWIVSIATALMLVAIISGVITHRKIFADFFTFRPRKGQRSWLDAHNATAVLALPFHFMITFSGLLLLMVMLMPWGIDAAYNGDTRAWLAERRAAAGQPPLPAPPQASIQAGSSQAGPPRAAGSDGAGRGQRGGEGGGERGAGDRRSAAAATPAPLAPLAPLVPLTPIGPIMAEAQRRWSQGEVGSLTIQQPGTAQARIEVRELTGHSLGNRGATERLVFDGVSGRLLEAPVIPAPSGATATYNVLTAPHLGRFAGPALRWLLFLSGVAGTLMVATGLLLWTAKRLPERRKLGRTPFGHRLVEVLNIAAITGLSLATASYFWLNRLIPVAAEGRSELEINGFFIVWGLALIHALVRPKTRAWREQLALATLLFAALPLLNPLTGGAGLATAIANGQWPIAGFDLAMLALALIHGLAFHWYRRSTGEAVSKRAPAGAGPTTAKQPPGRPATGPATATAAARAAASAAAAASVASATAGASAASTAVAEATLESALPTESH